MEKMYLYNCKIFNDFNIYMLDTKKRNFSRKIRIKKVDKILIDKSKYIKHSDKNFIVYSQIGKKFIEYKNGINMFIKKNKCLVKVEKENDELPNDNVLYRLSIGHGLLTMLRFHDNIVIHGTTILINNKTVTLLAPSGIGKTTFATYLLKFKNTYLISDDKTVIDRNKLTILPGSSMLRLCEDTLDWIIKDDDSRDYIVLNNNRKKFYYDSNYIKEQKVIKNCKAKYFIILRRNEKIYNPKIIKLNKNELFLELVKQIDCRRTLSYSELNNEISAIKQMVDLNIFGYIFEFNCDFEIIEKNIAFLYNFMGGLDNEEKI